MEEELAALVVLSEMSTNYYSYDLGREKIRVASGVLIPRFRSFDDSLLEWVNSEALAHEARLKQWIPYDFVAPKFWPLSWSPKQKFGPSDNANLAWLLLTMDYPKRNSARNYLGEFWKTVTVLMGLPVPRGDPGKKIRNHVRSILDYGLKQQLTNAEVEELERLVAKHCYESADKISWVTISENMGTALASFLVQGDSRTIGII
jgi:hypothetical protein